MNQQKGTNFAITTICGFTTVLFTLGPLLISPLILCILWKWVAPDISLLHQNLNWIPQSISYGLAFKSLLLIGIIFHGSSYFFMPFQLVFSTLHTWKMRQDA